ncbi:MAG: hypothetical protein DRP66_04295 [Planctomycetota bacterium]|nr:MAG: hypothetical protein DRP66_04295 [Planctomycetota bacterium]
MTTAVVITEYLNAVILALTPLERWAAAREGGGNALTDRWFIIAGIIAILILTVLLFATSFNRNRKEQAASDQLYYEYAARRGLAVRERQILRELARKAGLKRSESIFTLGVAFDRGAAGMIEENLADPNELSVLREKLGFRKPPNSSAGSPAISTKRSSRSIAVGKKVRITRRKTPGSDHIESIVVKNSDNGLSIKLEKSVKIIFGEPWCVRYHFGSSIREFDTTVISYDGDVLLLNHSENVRFINRRRFLRVPVARPALIAPFPFARTLAETGDRDEPTANDHSARASVISWGLPQFVPAVVTELAGPGLRIKSSLNVKIGQRVLVVFDLHQDRDSIPPNPDNRQLARKVVEDIGEVRHTRPVEGGFSIAVELTGLSDSNVDELTRVGNAASRSTGGKNKNIPTSGDAVESAPERIGV